MQASTPALSAEDAGLLGELLTSARQIRMGHYGNTGQEAMAALICDVLALDAQTYQEVMSRAVSGDPLRVSVAGELSL